MAEKLSQWRMATESTCVCGFMKAEFGTSDARTVYDIECAFRLRTIHCGNAFICGTP